VRFSNTARTSVTAYAGAALLHVALATGQVMRPDAQFPRLIASGGPPAAVLVGPHNGAALGAPAVRFQWQSDASKLPAARYEICVRTLPARPVSLPRQMGLRRARSWAVHPVIPLQRIESH
jgi:hypothetical protein